MRILFLTQVLPYPLDSGPKVRAHYVLRHLTQSHAVTLLSFTRPSDSSEFFAHLREFCSDVRTVPVQRAPVAEALSLARSLLTNQPHTVVRDDQPAMHAAVRALTEAGPFDAVHADQLAMAVYALGIDRARARLRVVDAHNAYYRIPRRLTEVDTHPLWRLYHRREAALLVRHEAQVYAQFDRVLTVTDNDRACLEALMAPAARDKFRTLPICVDAGVLPVARAENPRGLLLLGGLHWQPNADAARWFATEIFPRVRARVPDARLFIVGARPPADIVALGNSLGAASPAQAGDAPVVVTGYVADPAPFIAASAALLAPLRSGGGMRVKIVEAMQWGLPVIATTIGAEGIALSPGYDALISDTVEGLADAAVRVLTEPETAQALSEHGRALVAARYDWRTVYAALDEVYR